MGAKTFGVIHHLISGIADCSSAPSVLAWEGKGSYIPDIRLTVCIFFLYLLSLPGISKDVWELSQMLGRGGRGGENAAFVVLRWVGQAGT